MATSQTPAEALTARILADLEAGNLPPWQKPWRADASMPRNAVSGKAYRGANVWFLRLTAEVIGYSDPRWMTYKQAQALGGTVRKGEKATPVFFYKPRDERETVNAEGETVTERSGMMLRLYYVFNVEQTDGTRVKPLEVLPAPDPIEAAEAIIAGMPNAPRVERVGGRACYIPTLDIIRLPKVEDFESAEAGYSTHFHEIVHSTGNENRVGRDGVTEAQHFGSDQYGREELVAEMGAAMLSAEAGISPAVIENSTAYLASWIRTIKEDPRIILTAASAAQKAVDYVLDRKAVEAPAAA